jgi:hypothetical protein
MTLHVVKLKSSLQRFDGHHRDLINRYEVSVSYIGVKLSTRPVMSLCEQVSY